MQGDWYLEQAVFDTLRFYSLFEMPLTKVQIWRSLVVARDDSGQRWHGHQAPSLQDVAETLSNSAMLKKKVGILWGYYWMRSAVHKEGPGGEEEKQEAIRYVRQRLTRHALAQQKWKIARRVGWWFDLVPLVRMVGGSGSLAWFNTSWSSDVDLFVVARRGRIWTARALLLLISQLSGRRRKYWDEISPDNICLNHYITEDALLMNRAVRNLYMAQQYTAMVPLIGLDVFGRWWEANQMWLRQYVIYPERPLIKSRLFIQERVWRQRIKELLENWLLELPGDLIERTLRWWQLRAIKKHEGRRGRLVNDRLHDRVVLSEDELAFHPNTKVPLILRKYYEEEGQRTLL